MSDNLTYEELQKQIHELTHRANQAEKFYTNVFEKSHSIMLLIHPEKGNILDANVTACAFYGYTKDELTNLRIMDINTLSGEEISEKMQQAKLGKRKHFNFRHRLANGEVKDVEVFSGPVTIGEEEVLYSIIHDISERRQYEQERESLIAKLEQALAEIKTLRGILPICSSCKKIRDDEGSWNILETYLHHHSEVKFTHGICPDCKGKFYSDIHISDHE
ncbi:MAG: PAS domain S-box protein [Nitrospira sp.]|nr:PAS domain S-box protein [Nitrospira sp.]